MSMGAVKKSAAFAGRFPASTDTSSALFDSAMDDNDTPPRLSFACKSARVPARFVYTVKSPSCINHCTFVALQIHKFAVPN